MAWDIEYYEQPNGTQPAEVFEDELDRRYSKLAGKLARAVLQLAQYGPLTGGGLIEACRGYAGLWEVRTIFNRVLAREFFGFDGGRVVLLHGYVKQVGQPASTPDFKRARNTGKTIRRLGASARRRLRRRRQMSRYQQRLRKRMQNPEFAAGFWEMDSELRLIEALDRIRQYCDISTEELARRMGRQRSTISRLFNAGHANPTLDTFSDILKALNVTAEIRLRPSKADEPPIKVDVDALQPRSA